MIMGAYRQILYHTIIDPYKREKVLTQQNENRLYSYIRAIINNKKCVLYAINGIEDHIHMLISIRVDIAISDFMKDLKVSSSKFIKQNKLFPCFKSWAVGYSIFTKDYSSLEMIKHYIDNQKEHHKKQSYYSEFGKLLKKMVYSSTPRQARGWREFVVVPRGYTPGYLELNPTRRWGISKCNLGILIIKKADTQIRSYNHVYSQFLMFCYFHDKCKLQCKEGSRPFPTMVFIIIS